MKVAEKLSIIKQKEGELNRLLQRRESIIDKTFPLPKEHASLEEYNKDYEEFLKNKKESFVELNNKIDLLTEEITHEKNIINKHNIEYGIDKKLSDIKQVRIELSLLMKIIKSKSVFNSVDIDVIDYLQIPERITELERVKNKLDAEIQFHNWSHKL